MELTAKSTYGTSYKMTLLAIGNRVNAEYEQSKNMSNVDKLLSLTNNVIESQFNLDKNSIVLECIGCVLLPISINGCITCMTMRR